VSGGEPIRCAQCAREIPASPGRQAGISILVLGDEYTYSYWRCDACGFYTVESYLYTSERIPRRNLMNRPKSVAALMADDSLTQGKHSSVGPATTKACSLNPTQVHRS